MKQTGRSKSKLYKGVYWRVTGGKYKFWFAAGSINGKHFAIYAKSEREAALKYDKKMIENGKDPVNI